MYYKVCLSTKVKPQKLAVGSGILVLEPDDYTKEEITTLNESISFVDVDYADLNHTSDNLVNVIRKLYRIKLDIEARKKLNQKIKDYTVYLPKIKAKEKQACILLYNLMGEFI